MSFLLDQLKKSGKKRRIELTLLEQMKKSEHTSETQSEPESNRVPEIYSGSLKIQQKFLYLLLGIFLISAGLFFWLKYAALPERRDNALQTASLEKNNQPSAEAIKTANKPKEPTTAKEPEKTALKAAPMKGIVIENKEAKTFPDTTDIKRSPEQKQTDNNRITYATPSAEPKQKITPEKTYAKSLPADNNEPVKIQRVVDISELPQTVKDSLPQIKLSSHLYKKDSPLVSINGRIMTEGYNVAEELYLEEITPEGVIMSYRSHRFSIKAQ
jgi:hypothetical protein